MPDNQPEAVKQLETSTEIKADKRLSAPENDLVNKLVDPKNQEKNTKFLKDLFDATIK